MTIDSARTLLSSQLTSHDLDLIVVDNGSGSADVKLLHSELEPAGVKIISLSENQGYAAGNNAGILYAMSSFGDGKFGADDAILLLNSDVTVKPDTLQICLDFLHENPNAGVVGPRVLLPDGKLDLACRRSFPNMTNSFWKLTGLARRFPDSPRFAGYNLTYLDEFETSEVDSVVGAFMLVRYQAIKDTGILDEDYFMYGEDLDWSYRIKSHGWKVVYFPAAIVVHLKGETTRRQSNRMIYQFYRSMWLFHKKHYANKTLFLLNWLIVAGVVVRGTIAFGRNLTRPASSKRVS